MKTYNIIYIDDFLIEKFVSQWIWDRMLEEYQTTFNLLIQDKNILPSDLSTYTTKNFKRFLWDNLLKKKWSNSTYNSYRKNLNSYCKYLLDEELIEVNPFDKIPKRKEPKQLPKTLTDKQTEELIKQLPKIFDKKTYPWYRNIVITYTFLLTWLRLSELTNLKIKDINIIESYIKVIKWKWNKQRIIPIQKELQKLLHDFNKFSKKEFDERDYFFTTKNWKKLNSLDMKRIMYKIRFWITFHFTWHQLRHTYATWLVRNNFDIYNISQILWHSKIDTTKIYLSSDTNKLKKQLDKIKLFSFPEVVS